MQKAQGIKAAAVRAGAKRRPAKAAGGAMSKSRRLAMPESEYAENREWSRKRQFS
jgi:hypothetical protein